MSEDEFGKEQGQLFGSKERSGLSVPKEEAEERSAPPGSRRRPGGPFEKMQRAAGVDEGVAARWFLPAAGLALVLFLIGGVMIISQARSLSSVESEVEALRERIAASGIGEQRARIDQLLTRVEELNAQLSAVGDLSTGVEDLQSRISEQGGTIETLSARLDELEQSASAASSAEASAASGSAADGGWVINLITVGDRESAVQFQERAKELGIDARIESVTRGDETLQRVVVPGFQSENEAQQAAMDVKNRLELSDDPWITRQ